jgi:hypothetical protein
MCKARSCKTAFLPAALLSQRRFCRPGSSHRRLRSPSFANQNRSKFSQKLQASSAHLLPGCQRTPSSQRAPRSHRTPSSQRAPRNRRRSQNDARGTSPSGKGLQATSLSSAPCCQDTAQREIFGTTQAESVVAGFAGSTVAGSVKDRRELIAGCPVRQIENHRNVKSGLRVEEYCLDAEASSTLSETGSPSPNPSPKPTMSLPTSPMS